MRQPDLSITLDLPPKSSHANARPGNWKAKAFPASKHAKACGEIVWGYAVQIGQPRWKSVVVRYTFRLPATKDGRGEDKRHDPDNLIAWAKKSLDLLTKYGIIANDNDVIYLPPVQLRADRYVPGQSFQESYLQIDIWQRRDGECPFCGHQEESNQALLCK